MFVNNNRVSEITMSYVFYFVYVIYESDNCYSNRLRFTLQLKFAFMFFGLDVAIVDAALEMFY